MKNKLEYPENLTEKVNEICRIWSNLRKDYPDSKSSYSTEEILAAFETYKKAADEYDVRNCEMLMYNFKFGMSAKDLSEKYKISSSRIHQCITDTLWHIAHVLIAGYPKQSKRSVAKNVTQMNESEFINYIAKQAKLTAYDKEMLIHDINNLRGNEWLDVVIENCTLSTVRRFNKMIKSVG